MITTTQIYGTRLTAREKEVLTCMAAGLSSKQIAGMLCIAENTVANHRKNMLQKTGAKTSAELIGRNIKEYSK